MTVTTPTAVPFSPPRIGGDEVAEVIATLESGWLTTGPRVRRFEREFAAYVGARHAVGQFPHAERIADTALSLPLSPAFTDAQIETVIRAVRGALGA